MVERSDTPYPHLFAPLALRCGTLPNRLIMGSMHTRLEHEAGGMRRLAAFYAARAAGGAALVITGGVSPNRAGRLDAEGPMLTTRAEIGEHRAITDAVHEAGGRVCLQILHTGRYGKHDELVAPSAVRSRINRREPHALSDAEVRATIDDFVRCAELAEAAGYDGVEIMGSEGYLPTQFMAPLTNHRDDDWGGDAQRRMRFPVELVRRTRAAVGERFLVVYRISAIDLVPDGNTAQELDELARAVQAAGADLLNTGIGWHEARVPTIAYMVPRGAFRFAVRRLRAAVDIPVVATNRLNTPEQVEDTLASGDADLVALARPLLADAEFASKARAGRAGHINTCIACNQACLDYIFRDRTASCLVNPRAARETEPQPRPERRLKVAVVGGGPAGMASAVAAAEQGHAVTLFEAGPALGGQFQLARQVPGKQEFDETLRYFRTRLGESAVELRLGVAPDAPALQAEGFEQVLLATGVRPRRPAIEGLEHPRVLFYPEVLSGAVVPGPRVAIVGAGGIGFDVAELLSAPPAPQDPVAAFIHSHGIDTDISVRGGLRERPPETPPRALWLLQRSPGTPGRRLAPTTGWALRAELLHRGVQMWGDVRYQRIDDAGLHIEVDGEPRLLEVDHVVICAGQEPERGLEDELRALGIAAQLIGGAREPAELDALRAIHEGVAIARALGTDAAAAAEVA